MASYPDSVKSFTTKLDGPGNTINAAHMNDVQDEIAAIEGGLLNGTARVNSSGLSVIGASTFTSRPVEPPPHMAVVFLASTVTIGSSADSTLAWTAQDILTNSSMHSTATNPARLTPQSTGVYQLTASVTCAENSTGSRFVVVQDSSGGDIAGVQVGNSSASAMRLTANGYKRFDALGGFAVVRFGGTAYSTMSLSSGVGITTFSMVKL